MAWVTTIHQRRGKWQGLSASELITPVVTGDQEVSVHAVVVDSREGVPDDLQQLRRSSAVQLDDLAGLRLGLALIRSVRCDVQEAMASVLHERPAGISLCSVNDSSACQL